MQVWPESLSFSGAVPRIYHSHDSIDTYATGIRAALSKDLGSLCLVHFNIILWQFERPCGILIIWVMQSRFGRQMFRKISDSPAQDCAEEMDTNNYAVLGKDGTVEDQYDMHRVGKKQELRVR